MKCNTFCIIKKQYYYNKEIAFIEFFIILWSIVRSPTQKATCNIVISWCSSSYFLSKIPKITQPIWTKVSVSVSATFKIVSDDPEYEICYGLAVLFNFDEAVQINPTLTISKSTPLKPPSQIQSSLSVGIILL